jgi:uncharacterized membrane protein YraQ (UPF0718 family)
MLAGPIINVVVMLSTYVAFSAPGNTMFGGPQMAVLMRMGLGFIVAFNTSLIIEWQARKYGNRLLSPRAIRDTAAAEEEDTGERVSLLRRLTNISETALSDFVDIMVFLVLGAFLASLVRILLPYTNYEDWLHQNPPVAILTMMVLALLLCLCSEADAFVAASFGPVAPASAKLAFLVLGPMLDLKLYMMFTRVFRARLIWVIVVSLVIQVYCFSLLIHYFTDDIIYWARETGFVR